MVRFPKIAPAPKYQSTKPRVREHVGELPILRGTQKQIKYASNIRDELFDHALFYYFSHENEDKKFVDLRNKNALWSACPGLRLDTPRDCVCRLDARLFPERLPMERVVENLPAALLAFAWRHRNAEYWIENKSWRSDVLEDENDFAFDFLTFFIALYVQTEK